jgi:hypothetical protein
VLRALDRDPQGRYRHGGEMRDARRECWSALPKP